MSAELIKRITETEKTGAQMENDAKQKAKQIVLEATAKAKCEYDAAVSSAKKEAVNTVTAAQASAENDSKKIFEENAKQCDKLKSIALSNMDKAMDIIIAKVVR